MLIGRIVKKVGRKRDECMEQLTKDMKALQVYLSTLHIAQHTLFYVYVTQYE